MTEAEAWGIDQVCEHWDITPEELRRAVAEGTAPTPAGYEEAPRRLDPRAGTTLLPEWDAAEIRAWPHPRGAGGTAAYEPSLSLVDHPDAVEVWREADHIAAELSDAAREADGDRARDLRRAAGRFSVREGVTRADVDLARRVLAADELYAESERARYDLADMSDLLTSEQREAVTWPVQVGEIDDAGYWAPRRRPAGREEWTAQQCAEHWGVAARTWRSYAQRGQAPAPVRRVGRTPVWDAAAVRAWIRPRRRARTDLTSPEE